jgi:hypothetical protein
MGTPGDKASLSHLCSISNEECLIMGLPLEGIKVIDFTGVQDLVSKGGTDSSSLAEHLRRRKQPQGSGAYLFLMS